MRSCAGHALRDGEGLLAAFNAARASHHHQILSANRDCRIVQTRSRKLYDRIIRFGIAADELVRLGDADNLLHSWHLIERAGIDLAFIARDPNGSALLPGDGMGAVSQRFDFLANSAHLLFGGLRLHHNQHS